MASNNSITELITCSICLDKFTSPKMLSCQHTFCLNCLRGLNGGRPSNEIHCPQCRKRHNIPRSGFQGFPDNLVIKNLLDLQDTAPTVAVNTSGNCSDCNSKGSLTKCEHCNANLCINCRLHHQKLLGEIDVHMNVLRQNWLQKRCATDRNVNNSMIDKLQCEEMKMNSLIDHHISSLENLRDRYTQYFNFARQVQHCSLISLDDDKTIGKNIHAKISEQLPLCKNVSSLNTFKNSIACMAGVSNLSRADGLKFTPSDIDAQLHYTVVGSLTSDGAVIDAQEAVSPPVREVLEQFAPGNHMLLNRCSSSFGSMGVNPSTTATVSSPTVLSIPTTTNSAMGDVAITPSDSAQLGNHQSLSAQEIDPSCDPPLINYRDKKRGWKTIISNKQKHFRQPLWCNPVGIAYCNKTGRILVADGVNGLVISSEIDGENACDFENGRIGLAYPFDITVSESGQVFVADTDDNRVVYFNEEGSYLGDFEPFTGGRSFAKISGVYWHKNHVLVVDRVLKNVSVYTETGFCVRYFGAKHLVDPMRVTVGPEDKVYVTEMDKSCICVFTWSGKFLKRFGEVEGTGACGVTVDSQGYISVARPKGNYVDVYAPNYEWYTRFGRPGGNGPGCLNNPSALKLLPDGRIIVGDNLNKRLQIF